MSADTRPSYTFGDTPLAIERLQLLARVFEPTSRAFLSGEVRTPPRQALDLGCGPGASTRLVAAATGATATLGLDASEAFLEVARRGAPAGVEFARHDVSVLPFPRAPVDLVYCRLLLAHLADVRSMVTGFASQLAPGGLLLVEEMEWLDTPHPALETYERIVVDLVASRGAPMYAGPVVHELPGGDGWSRDSSTVSTVPIAVADAARLYGMNLATWRDDPHVVAHHPAATIDGLAADLAALADDDGAEPMTWGVRQVVFARV